MTMEKGIITHVERGDKRELPGRDAIWLQTPEMTGGKYMSVCTTFYQPGTKVLPVHSHPQGEETGYVVSGKGTILIGAETYEVSAGSVFLSPQGVPHAVWNSGTEVMQIVFMYANGPEATITVAHEDIQF